MSWRKEAVALNSFVKAFILRQFRIIYR